MFQRMEPASEGGGTDGQGGQGVNGLPNTRPDNINSMWVDRNLKPKIEIHITVVTHRDGPDL